jgi:type VI secretion system secreted protein Hcp
VIEIAAVLAENGRASADPRRTFTFWGGSMPETYTKESVAALFKRPLLVGVLATAAAATIATPNPVLADSFLLLRGIKGESTDAKHKDEINVLSFTQSWTNTTTIGGGGTGAGKVQCGAITVLKNIDISSPNLLLHVASGRIIPDGRLTFRTEGGQPFEYYTIQMTEVVVNEVTQSDSPDPARIVEKIVLNARTYRFDYTAQNPSGGTGATPRFGFDCATGKRI